MASRYPAAEGESAYRSRASAPVPGAHTEPRPDGWSPPSTTCPPGLEYLMALDHLFVDQRTELFNVVSPIGGRNNYSVLNARGEPIFQVSESSGLCSRLCFGRKRPFKLQVYDQANREVLRMVRALTCTGCCCPCWPRELEVYSGETLLGSVTPEWCPWRPSFSVRDSTGETVLIVKGPFVQPLAVHVPFQIKSANGRHKIGVISKKWGGVCREVFTDSDKFGINFPADLDVKIKAVLLGAGLLIDLTYFDR